MPLLPLVTGIASSPMPETRSRTSRATSRAVGEPHPLARVEVEDHPVGIPGLAARIESPLRHVELERGELREPHERGAVPGDGVRLGTVGVTDDGGATQSGACSKFFSKNGRCGASGVPTPCTQRLRVTGRPATSGTMTGATSA